MSAKTIQYGFNTDGVYARCGDKIAYTALDYKSMTPENSFEPSYSIEDGDAFSVIRHSEEIFWTKKIPTAVKNVFRKHFGMKPLVDDGKEVLWGGMTSDQYLCKLARDATKARGHNMKPFKKVFGWSGKVYYQSSCKCCGKEVQVTPEPEPNGIDICGDACGSNCKG